MRQPLPYLRLPYPNHTTTQLVRPTPRYSQGNPRLLSFGYRRPPVRNVSTAGQAASEWQWQYQRQWHTHRSFTSSSTVNAKKGASPSAESSNQSKLVPAIEAKVKEYDEAQATDTDIETQIRLARTVKELEPLAEAWKEYTDAQDAITEAETLLLDSDPSMRSLAHEELTTLQSTLTTLLHTRLPSLLLPPSPTASLGAMIELKAGVGGDEAALFVEQVMRMYLRYAQTRGWRTEILSKTAGSIGTGTGTGLKDVTIKVDGEGAFGDFRFERGVHRVQRVPATESAGRVHTSTIAVVNKAWAWQILRARLLDQKMIQQAEDRRKTRQSQVRGMDRSDKVRTYNFPQDRVTDHRIGMTLTGLDAVLEGEGLEGVIRELKEHQRGLRMESLLETGEDLDE
ncbi:hypothetical protein QFC24_004351 [Naganishia onofrii]|uniref:Uncharacterized protein n=1 Tax=Naganishia onofrii TaxID=1851511 RepID=A0ACC2XDK4_9TREE|nr:hypothetical protein QFC24_004351 [Naganishia onofrii]